MLTRFECAFNLRFVMTTPHIVFAPSRGLPTTIHPDFASARAEALRLATARTGTEYQVFAKVGSVVSETVVRENFAPEASDKIVDPEPTSEELDLRGCINGQTLLLRDGTIATYVGEVSVDANKDRAGECPHVIKFSNGDLGDAGDDGLWGPFPTHPRDVVKILGATL